MKQLLKKSAFSLMLLLSSVPAVLGQCCPTNNTNNCSTSGGICNSNLNKNSRVHTNILYRSQASNTARTLAGWQTEIWRPFCCDYYGVGTFAFEYGQTFKEERIARDWFGASCLSFQGSAVNNRSDNALVADYFGLGSNYDGSICFCPRIQNFNFVWDAFVGLDPWLPGLYFRGSLPLTHSRWTLRNGNDHNNNNNNDNGCCNSVACCPSPTATGNFPECFISSATDTPVVSNIESALSCTPATTTASSIFGVNNSGCFNFCQMDDTKLAAVDLVLGYLLYSDDCYHLGIGIEYLAPTGTRYNGDEKYSGTYFRPQIGNGHHNELGGVINGHAVLWDDQQSQSLAFYMLGSITHMFKDRQCRLFDLCPNGAYSRYMLLREYNTDGTAGNLVRANNTSFANRVVDVEIPVKVDFSFEFVYCHCNWKAALGYNVYYHSHEEICDNNCNNNNNCYNNNNGCYTCPTTNNNYKVAGLTGSCCFPATVTYGTTCDATIIGDTTSGVTTAAPNATMFSTGNGALGTAVTASGSACLAYSTVAVNDLLATPGVSTTVACDSLYSVSTTPDATGFLTDSNLDWRSALSPAYLSHKLFGSINYMWCDECGWNPFLNIGFEVEFDGGNNCDNECISNATSTNSSVCGVNNVCRDNNERVGINQWGIWIKGGINF